MTNRELFIAELEEYISHETTIPFSEGAWEYFNSLKYIQEKEKPPFTEGGAKILEWMQNNYQAYNNILKAKEIGEGIFCPSRSVSGSLRKLIADGYVSKTAGTPTCYSITEAGKAVQVIYPVKNEEEDA